MSLFVCQNCGVVENTNLVNKYEVLNNGYPNMGLMDMHGQGDVDIDLSAIISEESGVKNSLKKKNEILMLCCQCNTGKHHDEFDRVKASKEEIALSLGSKYSAITPMDHEEGMIIKDDNCRFGYRLPTTKDIFESTLKEEVNKVPKSKRRETLAMLAGLSAEYGVDINTLFPNIQSEKENQSEEEKRYMLERAELKRQIKALKKQKNHNKDLLKILEEQYKEYR